MLLLVFVGPAAADLATLGTDGINSLVTGLDGDGVPIGQVEPYRPGKLNWDTDQTNYASNTVPSGVYFRTGGGFDAMDSANIFYHATGVAGLMIGKDHSVTGRTKADYAANRGVAPAALLVSAVGGEEGTTALNEEKYFLCVSA